MPALKRSHDVANSDADQISPLHRVRNMWQFANLVQWIYIFGKAAKIDDNIDVEVLETETLKPSSTILQDVALALVKMASSFRGITSDGLDEQLRKLYRTHLTDTNPFGEDESPTQFDVLDSLTKIRVLQQLTQWVMMHPERFRDKMEEQRDIDQTTWRIEPYGWDSEDRTYYVLDDNRLYRLTEPPEPAIPTKKMKKAKKMKTYRAGRRSSRRQRLSATSPDDDMSDGDMLTEVGDAVATVDRTVGEDSLGGMIWECIAVTLNEVETFLDGIARSRDDNEKVLRNQIRDHLLPILQKQEDSRKRREQQRERELLNQAKLANAKRSSRIRGKIEQQKHDEDAKREEERMRHEEAVERRAEAARIKREHERDFRMASREDRLKERETRRRRHEEELAQLSEDSRNLSELSGRMSERKLQADIERNQQALKELEEEEEDWIFDCTCGLYGRIDDGKHSIACEKCNIWQHSKCAGIEEAEAERQDFHFVCSRCERREREQAAPDRPTPIKLKVHRSSSPHSSPSNEVRQSIVVELPAKAADPGSSTQLPPGATNASVNAIETAKANGLANGLVPSLPQTSQLHSEELPVINDKAGSASSGREAMLRKNEETGHPADSGNATTFGVKTPSQQQNGGQSNGLGTVQLLATPSLAATRTHSSEHLNGIHSSPVGISPTKFSPQISATPTGATEVTRATKLTLSPMTSLAPAPSPQDPTPPIKPLDCRGSFSSDANLKDDWGSKMR